MVAAATAAAKRILILGDGLGWVELVVGGVGVLRGVVKTSSDCW
jgi:hypothetical protein